MVNKNEHEFIQPKQAIIKKSESDMTLENLPFVHPPCSLRTRHIYYEERMLLGPIIVRKRIANHPQREHTFHFDFKK
jgi:hypothetical protein